MVEGAEEIDEDGPEDGSGEKDGEELAAGGKGEAPSCVGAVTFAEAVLQRRMRAALAGGVQMQALSDDRRLLLRLGLHFM